MNVAYLKNTREDSFAVGKKLGSIFKPEEGKIYSGKVTGIAAGKMSIMLDCGTELNIKEGSLNKAVGDSVEFSAEKNKAGGISLRVLGANMARSSSEALTPCQTKDLFKQSGFITEENIFEIKQAWETEEAEVKERLAISKIQSRIAYASDNLTMHAINELLASGVSIQKLNLSMLNSVLKEVKESPEAVSEEDLDKIIENQMREHGLDTQGLEKKAEIAKALGEGNLPVTQRNIEYVEKCLKLYNSAGELTDGAIAQLVKGEGELTLSNFYGAGFVEALKNEGADIEFLNEKLESLFKAEGIESSEANRENARLLFEYDLPITKENIEKVEYLKTFKEQEGTQRIIDSAISAIKGGVKPENAVISDFADRENLLNKYDEIREILPQITSRQIAYVNSANMPLTLYNLRSVTVPADFSADTFDTTTRFTLAQIQHRLTNEAALRLANKGIDIDVMNINKALNELKNAENEIFAEAIEESGNKADAQNISKLSGVMDGVYRFNRLNREVYEGIINGRIKFNVEGVLVAKSKNGALEEFEKHMAAPDNRYGDSFDKATDSLKKIVEGLGLLSTEDNLRQAEILSKSGLDINFENMLKVKIIDRKVEALHENLSPRIAADMIKTGFDPMNAHIDQVNDYINEYNAKYGESPKDSIAETIYDMDRKNELDDSERESLIAMYKMFNALEKDGYAAIGFNLRAGHIPTLQNLLNSVSSGKNGISMEAAEDGFTAKEATDTDKALRRLSHSGKNTYSDYLEQVTKEFANAVNTENLNKILNDKTLLDMPVDRLVDFLTEKNEGAEADKDNFEAGRIYEEVKEVLSQKAEVFAFLENIGMPATLENVRAYIQISKPNYFGGRIESLADEVGSDAGEHLVDIEKTDIGDENQPAKAMEDAAKGIEEKVIDSGKANLLREVRLLQTSIKVQNAISKRQNNFKIPVEIGGKAGQLNMFMPYGYIPTSGEINVGVAINAGGSTVNAMCRLDGNNAEITLDFQNVELEGDVNVNKLLQASLKEYGLNGTVTGFGENESFSASFDILPEMNRGHKEAIFNLGKAIMKFADNIFSEN